MPACHHLQSRSARFLRLIIGTISSILILASTGSIAEIGQSPAERGDISTRLHSKTLEASAKIGVGDEDLCLIPSLSSSAVKNGETLLIRAILKSTAGVSSVRAEILDDGQVLDGINMVPDTDASAPVMGPLGMPGGLRPNTPSSRDSLISSWSVAWKAHGLREKYYAVCIIATDKAGRILTDSSLEFSDPVVGKMTPGTTNYSSAAMKRLGSLESNKLDVDAEVALIDSVNGYLYIGNMNNSIAKFALGGAGPPVYVGGSQLAGGELKLGSGVIDVAAGYAYFGTNDDVTPDIGGKVIKVALNGSGPPIRVGAVQLPDGERLLRDAVIDPAAGYAYFTTDPGGSNFGRPAKIIKIALNGDGLPTRTGALTLNDGESYAHPAIDPQGGYLYVGTSPFSSTATNSTIVKIALNGDGPPLRASSLALEPGEVYVLSGVADPASQYLYFGTSNGKVVKVGTGGDGPPVRVGALQLNAGEFGLRGAAIDTAGGYAYFGCSTDPGRVVKVALGGAGIPTRIGVATLDPDEYYIVAGALDSANGYGYFLSLISPGKVVKINLGGAGPPSRHSATRLATEIHRGVMLVDESAGYLYVGTDEFPAKVAKYDINAPLPTKIGSLTLNMDEYEISAGVIDAQDGYAYFSTNTFPAKIVKVALGGSGAPTRVGALTLNPGETWLGSAVIDATANYAYFGSGFNISPGFIVKVALGGAGVPTRVGSVNLQAGEEFLSSGGIDTAGGHAYFGTTTSPAKIVKIGLGGAGAPTRIGALTLDPGDESVTASAVDPASGFGYFGSFYLNPPRLIKVALGGAGLPTRVGSLTLTDDASIKTLTIDAADGNLYVADGIKVIKFSVAGSGLPVRLGQVYFEAYEYPYGAALNRPSGHLYYLSKAEIIKIGTTGHTGQKGFLKSSTVTLPHPGSPTSLSFYSHAAVGNVRLSIFDDIYPRTLLWECAPTTNTITNGWLTVPISSGQPSSLMLPPGSYQLAWQVDTDADVPSYVPGAANIGLSANLPFNELPTKLDLYGAAATNEWWSIYMTYEGPADAADWDIYD